MTAEYNRLIRQGLRIFCEVPSINDQHLPRHDQLTRYMIKHVDGYLPPVDWKPSKLMKKIIIPIELTSDSNLCFAKRHFFCRKKD